MFSSGFIESDLTGVQVFGAENLEAVKLPSTFSMVKQLDSPHDQGNLGICVSVCVTDMCKYLCRGTGKSWVRELSYFYNCRKDQKQDGMSPREALGIALKDGLVKSYAFLRTAVAVRYSILANGPVMICLPVYNSSVTDFWNSKGRTSVEGYHAVTLVGFQDSGFTLRNSWGTSYGREGYSVFPYSAFSQVREAWTIFS